MDEDEDDFYGAGDQNGQQDQEMSGHDAPVKTEDANMSEEEDSDDDVQFTLEKPEAVKAEPAPTRGASKAVSVEPAKPSKTAQPSTTVKREPVEARNSRNELLHDGKEGKDFPEHRSSSINLEDDPTWPADGKKITELDIDADLAEHSKPWRLPGTDVTDFFNYGFDEYTWTQYCAKQQSMAGTIGELKEQDAQMKNMLGGMPNMDGGMPDMNAMMQMMMGGMGAPDPSKMGDFGQMMQMMGGMPPAGPGFNPQGGFPVQPGGNSPLPQGAQGFQPPLGPSGMQNQMDGFSAQQMQMLQQEQQQQGGYGGAGGGGRGRGRRGRGHY